MDLNGNILSRRDMLQSASCGFGYLALSALLARSARANELAPKTPTLPARAKRVIFLCMAGGPAHLDTFDYKPQLTNAAHPGSVFEHLTGMEGAFASGNALHQEAGFCIDKNAHVSSSDEAPSDARSKLSGFGLLFKSPVGFSDNNSMFFYGSDFFLSGMGTKIVNWYIDLFSMNEFIQMKF